MSADFQRIYIGELDVTVLGAFVVADMRPWTKASFQAVPRYGASYSAWVAKIQRTIAGPPVDFAAAINFTTSILNVPSQDMSDVDSVTITTTTVGSSGIVDLWAIVKSQASTF